MEFLVEISTFQRVSSEAFLFVMSVVELFKSQTEIQWNLGFDFIRVSDIYRYLIFRFVMHKPYFLIFGNFNVFMFFQISKKLMSLIACLCFYL